MLSSNSSIEDFLEATNTDISDYCRTVAARYSNGTEVKTLSKEVVAKIGWGVTKAEYDNQMYAWKHLSSGALRIPEPYRYFNIRDERRSGTGYLLMEFLDGKELHPADPHDVALASRTIYLMHQRSKTADVARPGPVSGQCADAFPWQYYEAEKPFKTVEDLEQCLSRRTRRRLWKFQNGTKDWVLCHLDATYHNFVRLPNGDVGLLDWKTSAIYPAYFEVAALIHQSKAYTKPEDERHFLNNVAKTLASLSYKTLQDSNNNITYLDVTSKEDVLALGTTQNVRRINDLPRLNKTTCLGAASESTLQCSDPSWTIAIETLLRLKPY